MPRIVVSASGDPVELAPGRGDLRFSSTPLGSSMGSVRGTPDGFVRLANKVVSYADIFATQPLVMAAISQLLYGALRVPLKMHRRIDDRGNTKRVRPGEHSVATALSKPRTGPGRYGSQADFVLSVLGQLFVHGSGPCRLHSGAGSAVEFELTDWRTLFPIRDSAWRVRGWGQTLPGGHELEPFSTRELLLPKFWNPLDSDMGLSPISVLGTTLLIEDSAQEHQAFGFKNQVQPSGVMKVDPSALPTDDERRKKVLARMRSEADRLYAGAANNRRAMLLPPGVEWQSVQHSAVEAALIEQRKLGERDILAVFGVMPPNLGIFDDATLANVETSQKMLYTEGLGRPLCLLESAINATVLRDLLHIDDEYYVEFDFGHVLRGDRLKEVQTLQKAINSALMTPNEGRSVLNLPSSDSPEADKLWIAGKNNMRTLEGDDGPEGARHG